MPHSHSRGDGPYDYVLGDSSAEADRLERQAELWDPIAHALFDRIGVRPGWRVLEIGPGQGSIHLELRRRAQRPVDVVEHSPIFAAAVRRRVQSDGLGEGQVWQTDIAAAPLMANTYDLIYARWVFCFLPSPEIQVRRLADALRPGGLLAIQDYAHREAFALFPRPAAWVDFLAADRALFAACGGDISIGGALPMLCREAGLEVVSATPTAMSGPPGSPVWHWLFRYFDSVRDRIAATAPMDPLKTARLRDDWCRAASDPFAFVAAPTVVNVVGRK